MMANTPRWAVYETRSSTGPFDDRLIAGPFVSQSEAEGAITSALAAARADGARLFDRDSFVDSSGELHALRADLYREAL